MIWLCPTARDTIKTGNAQVFNYTNPYTGLALKDTPGIVWKLTNEDGLADSMFRHGTTTFGGGRTASPGPDSTSTTHWMDQIPTGVNGNGYWTSEADSEWDAACSAISWTPPWGAGFPTRAETEALTSGSADRISMMQVVSNIEFAASQDLYDWAVGFNSNIIPIIADERYIGIMSTIALDRDPLPLMSCHVYIPDWDGQVSPNDTNYPQRGNVLQGTWSGAWMADGGAWSYQLGGARSVNQPGLITECGQYGESRWNYDMLYANALFAALQDFDGAWAYQGAQQKPQWLGTAGTEYADHITTGRYAHKLAMRCLAPIFEYGWVSPLSTTHTTTITDTSAATALATSGAPSSNNDYNAVRYHSTFPSGGGERAFLKKLLYLERHATTENLDDGNWPTMSDATYTAATRTSPIALSTELSMYEGGFIVNSTDRAYGWVSNVPASATIGRLTTGTAGTLDTFVLIWRSDTDAAIGTVNSRIFFHGFDYPTDASNFSTTTDGTSGLGSPSRGTMGNCELVMPAALALSLTVPQNQVVYGIDKEDQSLGSVVASSYSGGVLTFTTSTLYPEYLLVPI
jgi:hypothetical protein